MKSFSTGWKATGSYASSVINNTHGCVTCVSRDSHRVIFDDVLLNNGLSGRFSESLHYGSWIQVSLGQIPIVSRDVTGGLSRANSQFMQFGGHFIMFSIKFVSWVMAVSAERLHIFSLEVAAFAGVSLSRQTPLRSLRLLHRLLGARIVITLVRRFPMGSSACFRSRWWRLRLSFGLVDETHLWSPGFAQGTAEALSLASLHGSLHLFELADSRMI